MANKNKYADYVEPHLQEIEEWKRSGATDEQIARKLGIHVASLNNYKKRFPELKEAMLRGVQDLSLDLKGELARLSFKHTLTTRKNYIRKDLETGRKTQYTEITEKEVDGDVAAINLLLKNIDDNWSNDPQNLELRRQELELKKKIAEATNFDLEI